MKTSLMGQGGDSLKAYAPEGRRARAKNRQNFAQKRRSKGRWNTWARIQPPVYSEPTLNLVCTPGLQAGKWPESGAPVLYICWGELEQVGQQGWEGEDAVLRSQIKGHACFACGTIYPGSFGWLFYACLQGTDWHQISSPVFLNFIPAPYIMHAIISRFMPVLPDNFLGLPDRYYFFLLIILFHSKSAFSSRLSTRKKEYPYLASALPRLPGPIIPFWGSTKIGDPLNFWKDIIWLRLLSGHVQMIAALAPSGNLLISSSKASLSMGFSSARLPLTSASMKHSHPPKNPRSPVPFPKLSSLGVASSSWPRRRSS